MTDLSPNYGPHPIDDLAEPDEVADAIFVRLVVSQYAADPEVFGGIMRSVVVALPVNDPARPVTAPKAPNEPNARGSVGAALRHPGQHPRRASTGPARSKIAHRLTGTDVDGDRLQFQYVELMCPEHGREDFLAISVNDDTYLMASDDFPRLIRWLQARDNESRRK